MKKTKNVWVNIAGADTLTVHLGGGILKRIIIGNVVAGSSITLLDSSAPVAGSGRTIQALSITAGDAVGAIDYDLPFEAGLTVITTAAFNLTVVFEPLNISED